jgi:type IV pilus assembly protein PilE
MKFQRRSRGFSLIELMVTVTVIAILASIGVPSYGNYVRRGKVVEATSALTDVRMKMEQNFQDNRTFLNYVTASCIPVNVGSSPIIAPKSFTYSCVVSDATHYLITATGLAAKDMGGYVYKIDQDNAKKSTVPGGVEVNCWLTKPGETC